MSAEGRKPVSECFLVLYIKHNIFVFKHTYSIRLVTVVHLELLHQQLIKPTSLHFELLHVALPKFSLSKNIKNLSLACVLRIQ